jgi:hypothetical protein
MVAHRLFGSYQMLWLVSHSEEPVIYISIPCCFVIYLAILRRLAFYRITLFTVAAIQDYAIIFSYDGLKCEGADNCPIEVVPA